MPRPASIERIAVSVARHSSAHLQSPVEGSLLACFISRIMAYAHTTPAAIRRPRSVMATVIRPHLSSADVGRSMIAVAAAVFVANLMWHDVRDCRTFIIGLILWCHGYSGTQPCHFAPRHARRADDDSAIATFDAAAIAGFRSVILAADFVRNGRRLPPAACRFGAADNSR